MRRPAASLGLVSSIVLTLSLGTLDAPASVSISGPQVLLVGETVELVARGSPAGGRYRWRIEPSDPRALGQAGNRIGLLNTRVKGTARGKRLEIRGLAPSARPDDVRVVVDYQAGGATSQASWTLTCAAGELTAHRPRHGAGYAPFVRTPVDDADEESPTLGPGIRINGDVDPGVEDDLIEVAVDVAPANASFVLRRGTADLAVWTTPDKGPGSEVAFTNGVSAPFAPGSTGLTLWVEWAGAGHGLAGLELRPAGSSAAADALRFHSFRSIVMALGGENQVPTIPVSSNHGTFLVAIDLYGLGYDVHMHDEDDVGSNGAGPVYDEVVRAVQTRGVSEVVIYGYSHGGGSTHDLSERLDANRAAIGTFSIPYTSYVDGIENDSDIDVDPEVRLPPTSAYHVNHYQNGTFADLFLDGDAIPGSVPPPDGLDVETTAWGAAATHYVVDDYDQVRDLIRNDLIPRVNR